MILKINRSDIHTVKNNSIDNDDISLDSLDTAYHKKHKNSSDSLDRCFYNSNYYNSNTNRINNNTIYDQPFRMIINTESNRNRTLVNDIYLPE